MSMDNDVWVNQAIKEVARQDGRSVSVNATRSTTQVNGIVASIRS